MDTLIMQQQLRKVEAQQTGVAPILCVHKASQNQLYDRFYPSSRLLLLLLPHKNTHSLGLQTIHPMYHSPDDNRQSLSPYNISLLSFICGVCSYKKTFLACLMLCYNTIKAIIIAIIQINRWVNITLSYLMRFSQGIYNNSLPVYHIWVFLFNQILPVFLCCSNCTSQWGSCFKQNSHAVKTLAQRVLKSKTEATRPCIKF